jgi:hypothetical protein
MKKSKTPRPVRIEKHHGTIWVVYLDRKRYGRYCAGTFYAPDNTFESVVEWARNKPELEVAEIDWDSAK